jgi:[protein-PII] uridylyltransferase
LHTGAFTAPRSSAETWRGKVDASLQEKKTMTQQELIAKTIPGISAGRDQRALQSPARSLFHPHRRAEIALHIQMVNRLLKSITTADSVGSLRPVIEWKDDINAFPHRRQRRHLGPRRPLLQARRRLQRRRPEHPRRQGHLPHRPHRHRHLLRRRARPRRRAEAPPPRRNSPAPSRRRWSQRTSCPTSWRRPRKSRHPLPRHVDRRALQSSFPPTVDVLPRALDGAHIVEIQARDQIGLLYRLAKTISDHSFDITFARIGTERGVAIDTFYIEPSR